MSVKAHLLIGLEPLATGEIPFIGFAFALVRISELLVPDPSGVNPFRSNHQKMEPMAGIEHPDYRSNFLIPISFSAKPMIAKGSGRFKTFGAQ